MRPRYRNVVVGASLAGCLVCVDVAAAQPYPNRPIRLIVPSAAGGPIDIVARAAGSGMSEILGQQVVIDNRAGAGGMIGTEIAARTAADGYTLLLGVPSLLLIIPQINASATYTHNDFAPVSVVATMPMLMLVSPSLPVKSVTDLVALAKARPGQLNYASGGIGTGIHVAFEHFTMVAGVKITHVPYKGASPAMTGMIGGEADMMFNGLPAALPLMNQGRVRALAVGSRTRSELVPSVPSIAESGLNFEYTSWYSIVVPRGTPQPVVAKLHDAIVKTLAKPEMKERLTGQGVESIGSSPAEFAAFLKDENARLVQVITATGLRVKR